MADVLYGGRTGNAPPPLKPVEERFNPLRVTSPGNYRPVHKARGSDAAMATVREKADDAQAKAKGARDMEVRWRNEASHNVTSPPSQAQGAAMAEAADLYRQQAEHYERAATFYRQHNVIGGDRAMGHGDAGGIRVAERIKDLGLQGHLEAGSSVSIVK